MLAMVRDDYQVSYLCYMKDSIWLYNDEYCLYQHEYVTECEPSIFDHFQTGLNPGPLIWTLQLVDSQHDYIFYHGSSIREHDLNTIHIRMPYIRDLNPIVTTSDNLCQTAITIVVTFESKPNSWTTTTKTQQKSFIFSSYTLLII